MTDEPIEVVFTDGSVEYLPSREQMERDTIRMREDFERLMNIYNGMFGENWLVPRDQG